MPRNLNLEMSFNNSLLSELVDFASHPGVLFVIQDNVVH